MEELKSNNKGCLIPSHTNSIIYLFCIDKNCQQPSRILCQQCFLNRDVYHKNCDSFLTFEDSEQTKLKLEYSENSKLKDLFDWAYRPEEEMDEQVNQIYKDIQSQLFQKLEELKKETKVKMQKLQQDLKGKLKDYLTKQEQVCNLQLLEEEFVNFRKKQININQLNEYLKRKQEQTFPFDEKNKFLDTFYQTKIYSQIQKINPQMFQDLQQSLEDSLRKIPIYPPVFDKIQNLQLIKGCEIKLQKENNKYIKGKYYNMNAWYFNLQSETFKREQCVCFNFKFSNFNYNKQIYLGVIPIKEIEQNGQFTFNFQKGNGICFNKELNNIYQNCNQKYNKKWKYDNYCNTSNNNSNRNNNYFIRGGKMSGQKQLDQVFQEGQKFILNVWVEHNIIVLKDEKEECVIESTCDLKNLCDDQDWVIVIGDNGTQQQNFTIEVL